MFRQFLVKSFPRIHITLIDLAGVTYRRYGGAGFSLDAFPVEVESSLSLHNEVVFDHAVGTREEQDVRVLLERLTKELRSHFSLRVRSLPPQHVGFGSKTALLLAVGTACNALLRNPLNTADLRKLSGRGGTSGIGVNTFFHGGVIIDLGHPQSADDALVPSSAKQELTSPPIGIRLTFPQDWQLHLFLPEGKIYAGEDEVSFFRHNTPIPEEEVLRVLAAVYHGIVPAFLQHDHRLLRHALEDVHAIGFKRREVQGQGAGVRQLLELLHGHDNVAAGMSSMGPLVYAIVPADASASIEGIGVAMQEGGRVTYLGSCKGRNTGHETSGSQNA